MGILPDPLDRSGNGLEGSLSPRAFPRGALIRINETITSRCYLLGKHKLVVVCEGRLAKGLPVKYPDLCLVHFDKPAFLETTEKPG